MEGNSFVVDSGIIIIAVITVYGNTIALRYGKPNNTTTDGNVSRVRTSVANVNEIVE